MKKIAKGCSYNNRPSSLSRRAGTGSFYYADKCLSFRIKLKICL